MLRNWNTLHRMTFDLFVIIGILVTTSLLDTIHRRCITDSLNWLSLARLLILRANYDILITATKWIEEHWSIKSIGVLKYNLTFTSHTILALSVSHLLSTFSQICTRACSSVSQCSGRLRSLWKKWPNTHSVKTNKMFLARWQEVLSHKGHLLISGRTRRRLFAFTSWEKWYLYNSRVHIWYISGTTSQTSNSTDFAAC